jgi:hypothetical protein
MAFARPLEGLRAPLFLSVAAAFAVGPVRAQLVDQADLRHCAEMSTESRRLACFESLVDAAPPMPVVEEVPVAEPVPAPVEKSPAAPVSDVMPGVTEQTGTVAQAAVLPAVVAKKTVAAASASGSPPPSTTSPTAAAADFGAEHIEAPAEAARPEALAATVRSVKKDRYKRLQFEFANGQVWRQTEARHFPYPKGEPFDAVITRGMLGDYQLRVGGEGRMTRIQRLK